MKLRLLVALLFPLAPGALRTIHAAPALSQPAPAIMSGLGNSHHAVTTKSRQAQQFFDQGLRLVYGFNHDEARRSFQRAADLDPQLAMAWWGVALTLGPNYNLPVDSAREQAGYDAVQRALALQQHASEPERAYIRALAVRYSSDLKADLHALDLAFKEAMGKLSAQYPDDLDAATLYAESAMNLRPWHLWTADGKPVEGTEEILATLESVLKRDPNHLGANHYYIHAIEASPHAERGLASAERLTKLAPAAGHLVHMPAHIYARVGDHPAAERANKVAAIADRKYLEATHEQGVYPAMYYSHNLHFLAYAGCMDGSFTEAKDAARKLVANVSQQVSAMPDLEGFVPTPILVLLAFERWKDILALSAPNESFVMTTAIWHAARGRAFAHLGKITEAENEQKIFRETAAKIPREGMYDPLNKTADVFKIHDHVLAGALAQTRHEAAAAVSEFTEAVKAEDALSYSEPPAWYPPVRPTLGRELLAQNHLPEAEGIFRDDLARNPRNARALAGLRDCLQQAGRGYEAQQIDAQYRAAWNPSGALASTAAR